MKHTLKSRFGATVATTELGSIPTCHRTDKNVGTGLPLSEVWEHSLGDLQATEDVGFKIVANFLIAIWYRISKKRAYVAVCPIVHLRQVFPGTDRDVSSIVHQHINVSVD